ncbi:nitrilotriacetate monooxygenase component B [Penicillium sp. IBT 35674x]|nr:nitrilotriacetate monooxygenase component B [Penicillium sp. IBT 35674x]
MTGPVPVLWGARAPIPTQQLSCIRKNSSATAAAEQEYKIIQDVASFEEVESQRPDFDHERPIEVTKSPYPDWKYGDGVPDNDASLVQKHQEIDPCSPTRPMINNYRLLVSGIAPRPVGFISTANEKGQKNLSPFSYFQVIDHDPPIFIVGFSSRPGCVKDTYRNLKETGECVINTVSENMIEAVNASSIDAPYSVSEWDVSGLHEAPSTTVKPSRVAESVFSVEGKVVDIKEFADHQRPGMSIAATVLIEATRFWVKKGAADEDYSHIDLEKLRPVAQLGGVSYGRVVSTFERPRSKWDVEVPKSELLTRLNKSKPDLQ